MFIGSAAHPRILPEIVSGKGPGTFFLPAPDALGSRKRWIAFFEKSCGSLDLDEGAVRAILEGNRSLLAAGVTACQGTFAANAVIDLRNSQGALIARGITAYDSETIRQFKGLDSRRIREAHPERSRLEIIHRDNLVVL